MAFAVAACTGDPLPVAPSQSVSSPTAGSPSSVGGAFTVTPRPSPTVAVTASAATAVSAPSVPKPTATGEPKPTATPPVSSSPTVGLLRLRDDLDDPLGYCIDVRGFGSSIRLDASLQAHSCKSNSPDDQSFALVGDGPGGRILLIEYDVCLAVADTAPGASVHLRPCDDQSVSQQFEWLGDGRLRLQAERGVSQPELCVGVAGGDGEPAGGRDHLRRDLMLRDCGETDPALTAWEVVPNQ